MVFVPVTPEEGAKSSLPPIGRATTPRGISRGSSRSSSRGSVRPARQPTNARTARGSRSERRYVKVLKPDEVPLSARLATFHAGEEVEFIPGSPLIRLRTTKKLLEMPCATLHRIEKLSSPANTHRRLQLERRALRAIYAALDNPTARGLLCRNQRVVLEHLAAFDESEEKTGIIMGCDFLEGLRHLDVKFNLGISSMEEITLLTALDPEQSGEVNIHNFVKAFALKKLDSDVWKRSPRLTARDPFGMSVHKKKSFRYTGPKKGTVDRKAVFESATNRMRATELKIMEYDKAITKKTAARKIMIEMNEAFQVKILTREIDDLQLKLTTLRESSRPTTYVSTDPMRPWRTVSTRAPAPPSDASDLGT